MEIIVNINAANIQEAAVASVTDLTPVTSFPQLVLGDSEPLFIKFTDAGVAPTWAGADGYSLAVALGSLDVNGLLTKTITQSFTPITAGWTGRLGLATQELIDAMVFSVGNSVNWSRYPLGARFPGPVPTIGWFYLQIRVMDPQGNVETFALLRMAVLNRVLLNPREPLASQYPPAFAYQQTLEIDEDSEVAWDVSLGAAAYLLKTEDVFIQNPTNITDGLVYILELQNDGTGNRVPTWDDMFIWPSNTEPPPSTAAGRVDVYSFKARDGKLRGTMVGDFSS